MVLFFYIDSLSSSFEKKELDMCLSKFNKVVLVTYDQTCLNLKKENLEVFVLNFQSYKSTTYFFKALLYLPILIKEYLSCKVYFLKPKCFISNFSSFLRAIYIADELSSFYTKHGYKSDDSIHYSFWFNNWTTSLAVLKKKQLISNFYARTHGTDLFEDRVPLIKKIPFRSFQLKYIDKVFSVSKTGADYLINKYPNFKNKINTCYLGTTFHGKNPFNETGIFTIVSCAKIRNIKRIHLIANILFYIDMPIRWVHFGSENKGDPTISYLNENLNRLKIQKKNIEILFKGDVENEEIFNFYLNNSVNLFLSVSETEGLPVSMMEAISCGIPIMATDVGGCHEIVTESTGELIPENFNPELVSKKIVAFSLSNKNSHEFRERIVIFWNTYFNSEKNIDTFFNKLIN